MIEDRIKSEIYRYTIPIGDVSLFASLMKKFDCENDQSEITYVVTAKPILTTGFAYISDQTTEAVIGSKNANAAS